MKKRTIRRISFVIVALMLATLLTALASCEKKVNLSKLEGDELADAIYDLSAKDFKEDSMKNTKETLRGVLYGVSTDVEANTKAYSIGQDTDAPIFHGVSEVVMKFKMGNITQTSERNQTEGYRDGKMYVHREIDDEAMSLLSEISHADFEALNESLRYNTEDELNAAFKSASVKSAEHKENGNWAVTLSGYTEETLKMLIWNTMDNGVYLFEGYRPSDMKVTVEITDDHEPVSGALELVFEKTDEKTENEVPTAITTITIEDFGTATAPEVDLSGYTAVADLRPMILTQKSIGDMEMQDELAFTGEATGKVTFGSNIQKTEVMDDVLVETVDGKYGFTIQETQSPGTRDEMVIDMVFKNGRLQISGDDIESQSQSMTDNEARMTVTKMLDPASFPGALVSDIRVGKNGYDYAFTIHNPDYSEYEQSFAALNAKNYKATGTVSVKLKDGKVTEYRYDFELTATVQGETLKVKTTTVNTIPAEEAEPAPTN